MPRGATIAPMGAPAVLRKVRPDPPQPRDSDEIPERMCLRCGMLTQTPHEDAFDCISHLRDLVATLQLRRTYRPRRVPSRGRVVSMALDNVDEKRFNRADAVTAAGTGVAKSPQMTEFQQVVSEVIHSKDWPEILRG